MRLYRSRRRHYGFTLLEVLIAVSIFSIIGLSAHHVLQLVISSGAGAAANSEALSRLQRAMFLISNDLEQVIDRPVRDGRREWTDALVADHDAYLLEFTRQGWRNPLQLPRSNLQRVAYALQRFPDPAASGSLFLQSAALSLAGKGAHTGRPAARHGSAGKRTGCPVPLPGPGGSLAFGVAGQRRRGFTPGRRSGH